MGPNIQYLVSGSLWVDPRQLSDEKWVKRPLERKVIHKRDINLILVLTKLK